MSEKLTNGDVVILLSSLLSCVLRARCFISYSQLCNEIKLAFKLKHKLAILFWVAAGYVQAWQRAHDITLQHMH